MKSCIDCKHFVSRRKFHNTTQCIKRYKNGKAGLNFGLLYLDLANQCSDYSYSNLLSILDLDVGNTDKAYTGGYKKK